MEYSRRHRDRYIDVGIAEDVAVTTGAGLALQGEKPIVAIYSTFLQRGYDQVIHDVAIENLDVVFAIDRAGLVGGDGATHQGIFDIAYLRAVPNLAIAMPRDANKLQSMLKAAVETAGPVALRWPRGSVEPADHADPEAWPPVVWGKAERLKVGSEVVVLALGPTVGYALEAAGRDPRVGVVDMQFVKPLDVGLLHELAEEGVKLITVEDHTLPGGLGTAVAEALKDEGLDVPLKRLGLPDVFVPHGSPKAFHEAHGMGPEGLKSTLEAQLGSPLIDPEATVEENVVGGVTSD